MSKKIKVTCLLLTIFLAGGPVNIEQKYNWCFCATRDSASFKRDPLLVERRQEYFLSADVNAASIHAHWAART
jgi:hypothetical protein